MFRRSRPDPLAEVRPDLLPPALAEPVSATLALRQRFATMVGSAAAGPVRKVLAELAQDVDRAVLDGWHHARRAVELEAAFGHLDLDAASTELKSARRRVADLKAAAAPEHDVAGAEGEAAAAADRFATLNRLRNQLDDVANQLVRLRRELEGALASAAELALAPPGSDPASAAAAVHARLSAVGGALRDLG